LGNLIRAEVLTQGELVVWEDAAITVRVKKFQRCFAVWG
jgi:hypothetical protein